MKYLSTKTYNNLGSTCFRQWRAKSHCHFLHGYSLSFHFEFESSTLDDCNWVLDFGSLKGLKAYLEYLFDHTTLVASDDPEYKKFIDLDVMGLIKLREFKDVGCEALAEHLYHHVNKELLPQLTDRDVWCCKVEVRETQSNMAKIEGHREKINVW